MADIFSIDLDVNGAIDEYGEDGMRMSSDEEDLVCVCHCKSYAL